MSFSFVILVSMLVLSQVHLVLKPSLGQPEIMTFEASGLITFTSIC